MEDYAISDSTRNVYYPKDCIRLVNPKQVAFYMKKGIELLDVYPSSDLKTGEDILVFLVDKRKSYPAYLEWIKKKDEQE